MPSPTPKSDSDIQSVFFRASETISRFLERHRIACVGFFTVIYVLRVVLVARARPFWHDEIITLTAASQPDVKSVVEAVHKLDLTPPVLQILLHWLLPFLGNGEVALRVPSMIGFWIFCFCLFLFVVRRASAIYAISAFLLPIATDAFFYAYEARPYGLELGCCGVALVAWQAAADGRRRAISLLGLAAALIGAVSLHFYAVFVLLPFMGAETFRSFMNRRIDAPVWVALFAPLPPLVWFYSQIRLDLGRTTHGWAPPSPFQLLDFWQLELAPTLLLLIALLALLAWYSILPGGERSAVRPCTVKNHEMIAGALFLAIPAAALVCALLVTHMFTPRYAMVSLTGFVFLVALVPAKFAHGSDAVGMLLFAIALAGLGQRFTAVPRFQNPLQGEPILEAALRQGPVTIPNGHLFLQVWYYAPAEIKNRILFVADAPAAVRFTQSDSLDSEFLNLRTIIDVPIYDYKTFLQRSSGDFLLYQDVGRPGWLLPQSLADGAVAQTIAYDGARSLIRVKVAGQ